MRSLNLRQGGCDPLLGTGDWRLGIEGDGGVGGAEGDNDY